MTPAGETEAEFIALWNEGLTTAAIAERLGIAPGTARSRAYTLQQRGLILPRPKGSRRTPARREGTPASVQIGADMHGVQTVYDSAVHGGMHGAVPVQNSVEPPIPSALAEELRRLWAAIDTLRQDVHRPVHDPVHATVPSLPEPLFNDPEDNTTERWNLYLKRGLRVRIESLAQARGIAPSRVVQELLWTALTDRRASPR
jgi:hypothetical protein